MHNFSYVFASYIADNSDTDYKMCFVRSCCTGFSDNILAASLSLYTTVGCFCSKPSSANSLRIHTTWRAHKQHAIYSLSQLDNATHAYLLCIRMLGLEPDYACSIAVSVLHGVLPRVTWSHPQRYRGPAKGHMVASPALQGTIGVPQHHPSTSIHPSTTHRDKDVPIFSWKLGRITSFTPSNHVFRTMFSCLAPDHVFSPCFSKKTKNNRFDHVFRPIFCSSTWCKEPKGVAGAGP